MNKEKSTPKPKSRKDIEKSILVSDQTIIKKGLETIKLSDLEVGDIIMAVGTQTDTGQIKAKLIHVLPC